MENEKQDALLIAEQLRALGFGGICNQAATLLRDLHAENETMREMMRETLQGIAQADWREWEELARPIEFVRWAQARANHVLQSNAGNQRGA